jgi:hypothetical protein
LQQNNKIHLDFVITGTGRCGTVYAAKLLTSLGHPCTHESIFTPEGIFYALKTLGSGSLKNSKCSKKENSNWYPEGVLPVGESSYMAANFLGHKILNGVKIVHLIRDPAKVIFSWIRFGYFQNKTHKLLKPWEDNISIEIPEIWHYDNPIERACYYYLAWNKLIELNADESLYFKHRIEDGNGFLGFLNIEDKTDSFSNKHSNTNNKKGDKRSYKDIPESPLKEEIVKFAIEHGYDTSEKNSKIF